MSSWRGGESWGDPEWGEDLALGIHRREDGAFEALVGSFEKPLFNYVQRIVDTVEDAQEVVQDTFLRAHRALTQQYSESRVGSLLLRPWLFRIARNLSHNKRRGKRREVEQPMPEGASRSVEDRRNGPISILCAVEHKEELDRLDRSLARLSVETRELIVLRFIEELSYNEIARATGSGESALRGKVFRGLRQLREILQNEEAENAM